MSTPDPLNLPSLARTDPGQTRLIPGTNLTVQALEEKKSQRLERPMWLAVLTGELIIDLPYGDFRLLKGGDSLHLEAGLEVTFTPVEETVVLRIS